MKNTFKKIIAATGLVLAAASAQAVNVVNQLPLSGSPSTGYTGTLSAPNGSDVTHLFSGNFTDIFTFSFSGNSLVDVSLVTIGNDDDPAQQIVFTSADLNGIPVAFSRTDFGGVILRTGLLAGVPTSGDLVLTIHGYAGLLGDIGSEIAASYSGTLNVSAVAVPEPESFALLLGGLGVIGWTARRRRPV